MMNSRRVSNKTMVVSLVLEPYPDLVDKLCDDMAAREEAAIDARMTVGALRGIIAETPRGRRGFGWDSAFVPDGFQGRSFAEMSPVEKNTISHRSKAFASLRDGLEKRGFL